MPLKTVLIFVAQTKNWLWGKHVTGNPQPCAYFNDLDLAILRILGNSAAFCGVKKCAYDTPIVMASPQSRVDVANATQI